MPDVFDASLLAVLPEALTGGDCAVEVSTAGVGVVGSLTLGAGVVDPEALGAELATSSEAFGELGIASGVWLLRLLVEAWRAAFPSFAGLLGLSSLVVRDVDSLVTEAFGISTAGAVSMVGVSTFAASVVASLMVAGAFEATAVSAAVARGFAVFAVTSGLGSWPTLWLSTTAPPMATAVMTPNAMPKWFTFFSSWL